MPRIILQAALAAILLVGLGVKLTAVSSGVVAAGQPAPTIEAIDFDSRAPLTLPSVAADLS